MLVEYPTAARLTPAVMPELKIDQERQMVRGVAGQSRVDDSCVANDERAADIRLVERHDRPVGRERPKAGSGRGNLRETVVRHRTLGQRVEPVVEVADDQGWQVGRLAKQGVVEQVPGLPVPLPLRQAQVPVDEMDEALRCFDDHDLGATGFFPVVAERNLMADPKRPARQHEIAVTARSETHIELEEVGRYLQGRRQPVRLIVVSRPRDVPVDLLKADEIGFLVGDDLHNAFERITAIAAADPFVDVIAD
jgi:hypothetical protein